MGSEYMRSVSTWPVSLVTSSKAFHCISFCGGNNREPIFANDEDRQFFKEALLDVARRHDLSIHAYVFMTNHIHLLVSPASEQSMPKTMQSVGRRYVQYFNYRYRRTGTLWEGRYRATVVEAEAYLFECMRYIEFNPVRAGMARHPCDHAWPGIGDQLNIDRLLRHTRQNENFFSFYLRAPARARANLDTIICAR